MMTLIHLFYDKPVLSYELILIFLLLLLFGHKNVYHIAYALI